MFEPVVEQIKQGIISGKYKPGDAIPSERVLSRQFKISRMSVRKAIDTLVQAGYLVKKPGLGTFVPDESTRQEQTGTVELTVEHNPYPRSGLIMRIIAKSFERHNPWVRIRFVPSSGSADVLFGDEIRLRELGQGGSILPLDQYVAKDLELDAYFSRLFTFLTHEGHLYGVPVVWSPVVVLYNREILEELGLAPPSDSWCPRDLVELCNAITDPAERRFAFGWTENYKRWVPFVWNCGGRIYDQAKDRITISEKETIEALVTYRKLLEHSPAFRIKRDFFSSDQLFVAGAAAVVLGTAYLVGELKRGRLQFGCAPMPTIEGVPPVSAVALEALGISAGSEKRDLAWEFVKFALTEGQREYAHCRYGLPVLRQWEDELCKEEPYYRVFYAQEPHLASVWPLPDVRLLAMFSNSMTMLWYGQSEVENAAQEVEAVINLARQRNMYQLPFG